MDGDLPRNLATRGNGDMKTSGSIGNWKCGALFGAVLLGAALVSDGAPASRGSLRLAAKPANAADKTPTGPPREDAVLHRKLAIPGKFLITRKGHTFGGDLRIGDLNGDGRCDFLVYRCNHGAPRGAHMGGMKPTFLGAFDLDGKALWSVGGGGNHPSRPMSVAVKDWTGDGADDVICFWHNPRPDLKTD